MVSPKSNPYKGKDIPTIKDAITPINKKTRPWEAILRILQNGAFSLAGIC